MSSEGDTSGAFGLLLSLDNNKLTNFMEELTGSQLVKKFPAFYVNRKFITVCTRARVPR
jgi:hypothetical protein